MDATVTAALLTAAIGSTGVIGLISALLTRVRASRARRFIDDALVVKSALSADSVAYKAIEQAITTTALRLAVDQLSRWSVQTKVLAWLTSAIISVGLAFAFVPLATEVFSAGDTRSTTITLGVFAVLALYVGVAVAAVILFDQADRRARMNGLLLAVPAPVPTRAVKEARRRRRIRMQGERRRANRKTTPRSLRRLARLRARVKAAPWRRPQTRQIESS